MGTPARGYSWPPFTEGNDAAEKHGAWSERKWRPIADVLAEVLPTIAPWATRDAYAGAAASLCRVEAQLWLVSEYLNDVGLLDAEGEPRPATKLADRLESRAQSLRTELGLSPLALARLMGAMASAAGSAGLDDELEALRAEGRRIIEARVAGQGALAEGDETEGVA